MARSAPRKAGRPRHPVDRSTLIAIARAAFAEAGYAGATMNAIAEQAGLRKASLFHHFPTKQALYIEVVSSIATDLGNLVFEADLATGEFRHRLDRVTERLVRYLGTHPESAKLLMRDAIDSGEFVQGPGRDIIQAVLTAATHFFTYAMERGDIPRQDPQQLTLSILGIHMTCFAIVDLSSGLSGEDILSERMVDRRARETCAHVRRVCGLPPRDEDR